MYLSAKLHIKLITLVTFLMSLSCQLVDNRIKGVAPKIVPTISKKIITAVGTTTTVFEKNGFTNSEEWHDGFTQWKFRKFLSIRYTGTQINGFPARLQINSSWFDYAKLKSDGSDLVFLDSDGVTRLNYEIEKWEYNGVSTIWINIPAVNDITNDFVWMYYGNSVANFEQDPLLVWDANYIAVHHFSGDLDSTSNANDFTLHQNVTSLPGDFGDFSRFNGTDSYSEASGLGNWPAGTSSRSLCAWVRPDGINNGNQIIASYGTATIQGLFEMGRRSFFGLVSANDQIDRPSVSPGFEDNVWAYYCVTRQTSILYQFVNGELQGADNAIDQWSVVLDKFHVGQSILGDSSWKGDIDELRISSTQRSEAWLKAEHFTFTNDFFKPHKEESPNSGKHRIEFNMNQEFSKDVFIPFTLAFDSSSPSTPNNSLTDGNLTIPMGSKSAFIEFAVFQNKNFNQYEATIQFHETAESKSLGIDLSKINNMKLTFVNDIGTPPVAMNDSIETSPGVNVIIPVLDNDSDPDGHALKIFYVNYPSNGSIEFINGEAVIYKPDPGFVGLDSFNYSISDETGFTSSATISVSVQPSKFWTGLGGDQLWSNVGNWNSNQMPSALDLVYFDDSFCLTNCNISMDIPVTVGALYLSANFTGTISQGVGVSLNIGISDDGIFSILGGAFVGSTGTINLYGEIQLLNGTFTSSSGIFNIYPRSTMTSLPFFKHASPAQFLHNNGEVVVNIPYAICGSLFYAKRILETNTTLSFFDIYVKGGAGICDSSSAISIEFNTSGSGSFEVLGEYRETGTSHQSKGLLNLYGDFRRTSSGTAWGGVHIKFVGGGVQYYYSGTHPDAFLNYFEVDKSGGSVESGDDTTLSINQLKITRGIFKAPGSPGILSIGVFGFSSSSLSNNTLFEITVNGTFDHGNGSARLTSKNQGCDDVTIETNGQVTAFNDVDFRKGAYDNCSSNIVKIASGSTLSVEGDLILSSTQVNGPGVIQTLGNVTVSSNFKTSSNVAIHFLGSGTQNLTDTSNRFPMGDVMVNKPSGILDLQSAWYINASGQSLHLQSGTINMNSGVLDINDVLTMESGTIINQGGNTLLYNSLIDNGGTVNP